MNSYGQIAAAVLGATLAAVAAAGPPRTPPPRVQGVPTAPPPAWIETGGHSVWLAYGSYCWRTSCVDFLPPAKRKLPLAVVRPQARINVHLRFRPRRLIVKVGSRAIRIAEQTVVRWRVTHGGIVDVEARGTGGSASYLARLRLSRS
jgi:hypothetical protein